MSELSDSHSAEAINAAANAQEAVERARESQIDSAVKKGLEGFFNRNIETGRFIPLKANRMADVERFQFICDQIDDIHSRLKDIEDNISWGVKIVVGSVITGLLAILFKSFI